jgi:hypothetical protein
MRNTEQRSPGLAIRPRRVPGRALAAVLLGCLALGFLAAAAVADAAPVHMRFPEGPTHGFLTVTDVATDKKIAAGELTQWIEKRAIASRLVIRFDDGSLHDETVRFAQRPVFRVVSYEQKQKGPAFAEDSSVKFDRSGRYEVRQRPRGEDEKTAAGTFEVPDDVCNGLTSVLIKNLQRGTSASVHMVTFRPEPLVLDVELTTEGTDRYWVGDVASEATRWLVKPTVPGVKGMLASVVGKQPPEVRIWIAPEPAPVLVRFEGALYVDGPVWRIELSAPRWKS